MVTKAFSPTASFADTECLMFKSPFPKNAFLRTIIDHNTIRQNWIYHNHEQNVLTVTAIKAKKG